jgi:GT2 family glycosyltransferase
MHCYVCDTTIVIPQRNHVDLTAACIASLHVTDPEPWPVVVVDDASEPFQPLPLQSPSLAMHGPVRTVRHQQHLGVAAAWNSGARHTRTPFVVWLNNDVIAHGPWVRRLTEPLRTRELDIVCTAWRAERAVDGERLAALGGKRFPQGWCFAARRVDWQRLEGFDEATAIYWSDTDFFLRARIAELRIGIVSDLPLVHLGHRTAHDPESLADRAKRWHEDRTAFLEKWGFVERVRLAAIESDAARAARGRRA